VQDPCDGARESDTGRVAERNLEAVNRWFEALNDEDFDVAIALMQPDAEVVPPGGQPPYRGAESLRRWLEPDALQGQSFEQLETVVAEDGTVLVKHRVKARGANSGFPLDVISWSVWTLDQEGLITRAEIFLEHEEDRARLVAGLEG
jgi:ketosteroid isomerase-like protein